MSGLCDHGDGVNCGAARVEAFVSKAVVRSRCASLLHTLRASTLSRRRSGIHFVLA